MQHHCLIAWWGTIRGGTISEAVHYRVRVRVAALSNAIRWPLFLLAVSENILMHCAKLPDIGTWYGERSIGGADGVPLAEAC